MLSTFIPYFQIINPHTNFPRVINKKMGLREIGSSLPPGFRFYPSDEELVCHYLFKKVANEEVDKGTLMEINLHTCEPWELPEGAKLNVTEWYFFNFRDRKYATGFRTNRATQTGYWKATGKDRLVYSSTTHTIVGMRKTLVFYQNRAPNGIKTGWIMHEFRLENPHTPPKEDWVLCRVFHKGKGENNNQYSPKNEFESSSSTFFGAPPSTYQTNYSCNGHQQANPSFFHSPPYQNQNQISNPNFLHLSPQTVDIAAIRANTLVHDYEYDFSFEMEYEESNIGDGLTTNFEEIMRYGDDINLVSL